MMDIVKCISCEGYGWFEDAFTTEVEDCDWCDGVGYVYRDDGSVDHKIPPADYGKVADRLERLETERMRDMGYTGAAKKPWQQDIRKGTQGGLSPAERQSSSDDDSD